MVYKIHYLFFGVLDEILVYFIYLIEFLSSGEEMLGIEVVVEIWSEVV